MIKNTKDGKETKDIKDNKETQQSSKLAVFEEDDYFEEFDDEEWTESGAKDEIDFNKWQEEWEDEEINDQFEKVLRREMENFKNATKTKN
jgi:26 proteasome complex subunit DSS1